LSRLPGKRARPVLRGPRRSNAPGLPAERWFGLLTEQLIRRGVHQSVVALENDVREWIKNWNQHPTPFVWTKAAEDILQSLTKIYREDLRRGTLVLRN